MIRTARLVMRPARADDVAPMHAVLSHPVAMRYWSTAPHQEVAETEAWIASMIGAHARGESADDCILELDGRVIGKAGFWRDPELGYILHPDVHGRGLMQEALSALLDRAFSMRRLPRATADVDPRNAASRRLLERLGFVQTGSARATFNVGGQWCDSVFYALDAAAWWRRAR